jgi:hypothetical protein
MSMTKTEAVQAANDLRYWAQEFGRLTGTLANMIEEDNKPAAIQEMDAAIDAWNVLINKAPSILKRIKLHYPLLNGGDVKTSDV